MNIKKVEFLIVGDLEAEDPATMDAAKADLLDLIEKNLAAITASVGDIQRAGPRMLDSLAVIEEQLADVRFCIGRVCDAATGRSRK